MKKIYLTSLMLVVCMTLFSLQAIAQAPQTMTYQSVLRNSSNNLLVNTAVGTKISVLQGTVSGTVSYAETQTTTTNANGLLSLQIGTGTVITGVFADIDWANGPYFIKTETDPTGGSSYTIAGTQQMASVPYALFAAKSGDAIAGPQGPIGLTGAAGSNGNDGATGAQGIQGSIGLTGAAGTNGEVGEIGATGAQGMQGLTGAMGPQGLQGLIGVTGAIGPQGIQGLTGLTGVAGSKGETGETGPQGIQGDIGLTGATGPEGPQGLTGPQGIQGDIGLTGATGPQGIQGLTGFTGIAGANGINGTDGAQGIQGLTGPQGIQGDIGLTGATGLQGLRGLTGIAGSNGTNGTNGAQGIQGLTGPQGIQGLQGLTGPAGPAGSSLIGESQLLQGLTGATGPQGPQGLTGPQGIQGDIGLTRATGLQGLTGDTGATRSQGIQGDRGLTGATGPQGIQGVTGTAGAQGIQGLTGLTGTAGSNGTNGAQGIQGVAGAGYNGITSTTSATPASSGTIVLTTNQQGAFKTGDRIRVFNTASNYFEGMLTTTSGTTFSIVADYNVGTTVASSWTVSLTGVRGATGATGIQGLTGSAGSTGTNGAAGPQGIQGVTGATGPQGTQGVTGTTGAQGIQGLTGATGAAGANGTNGAQGIQGVTGAGYNSITSTTSATPAGTGTIVLTTNQQGAFITGDRIRVVNTTSNYFEGIVTITSATTFSIVADYNVGTTAASSWTVSLTGVRGATGATGIQGLTGAAGSNGTNGAAGQQGIQGLTGLTGATGTQGIQGLTGATGPQGIKGETGLIAAGTVAGQMNYWNGTAWVTVAPGTRTQTLTYCDGVPTWGPCLPLLTTTSANAITGFSATSGGSITIDNGELVIARGVCWSTSTNPTIALSTKTNDGTGNGTFTSSITELKGATLYYFRAYATNSVGTSYGVQQSFTTLAASLPTLTTTAITQTGLIASSGGNIANDGGAAVSSRGICWSTTANPTIALTTKTTDGNGSGIFTSSTTGLNIGALYYVRAYATNSVGTTYGNQQSFTSFSLPTLTTTAATNVSGATATSGGSITNDGGTAVTSRGVCWSTTANPTIALSTKTINGTGAGVFTSSITGLNVSTLYHVRAYATNSVGTTYGTDLTFTTNTFVIGATYLGGKIAYIDATGIHGLIVSTSTENTSAEYGCMKYVQGATGTAIGTGAANTTKIVNGCATSGIAARWCDGVNINGYVDWYLPSVNELMQVYSNRVAIGVVFNGVNYWSSTEKDGFYAYSIDFLDGTTNSSTSKSSLLYVRPVRSF